jgi:hypothetical protein
MSYAEFIEHMKTAHNIQGGISCTRSLVMHARRRKPSAPLYKYRLDFDGAATVLEESE